MASTKKYFHDHFVLLLLSINAFLAALTVIFVSFKLGTSNGNDYIVGYRPSLGLNRYRPGSLLGMLGFIGFAIVVMVINLGISYKVYKIHRQLSIAVLSMGILLLVLAIIISNALFLLRQG